MKKLTHLIGLLVNIVAGAAGGNAAITQTFISTTENPELIGWSCFRPGSFPYTGPGSVPWNLTVTSPDYERTQPWNSAEHRKYKIREVDGYYSSVNNWNGGETHEFLYAGQAVWGVTAILTYAEALHQFTHNGITEWDPNITLVTSVGEETDGNIFSFSVYPLLNYTQTLTLREGDGDAALASGGYGTTLLMDPDTLEDALDRAGSTTGSLTYSGRALSAATVPESTSPIALGEYTQTQISFSVTSLPAGHTRLLVTYLRKNFTTGASLTPASSTESVSLSISGSNATAVYSIPVPGENEKYIFDSAQTAAP